MYWTDKDNNASIKMIIFDVAIILCFVESDILIDKRLYSLPIYHDIVRLFAV
jgi:hypothetical protein